MWNLSQLWFLHFEPQWSCNQFPTDGPLVSAGSSKGVWVSYLGTYFPGAFIGGTDRHLLVALLVGQFHV
jgi:hypothetical protein